jgi:hypothetical protein
MIGIADARFQDDLARAARRADKLAPDYRVPDSARANTPERISAALAPFRQRGLFPEFPFGSDFSAEERRLIPALQHLKTRSSTLRGKLGLVLDAFFQGGSEDDLMPLIERMGLAHPEGMEEKLYRRLLALALKQTQ